MSTFFDEFFRQILYAAISLAFWTGYGGNSQPVVDHCPVAKIYAK